MVHILIYEPLRHSPDQRMYHKCFYGTFVANKIRRMCHIWLYDPFASLTILYFHTHQLFTVGRIGFVEPLESYFFVEPDCNMVIWSHA